MNNPVLAAQQAARRARILAALETNGPSTVKQIVTATDMSTHTVRDDLKVLRAEGGVHKQSSQRRRQSGSSGALWAAGPGDTAEVLGPGEIIVRPMLGMDAWMQKHDARHDPVLFLTAGRLPCKEAHYAA